MRLLVCGGREFKDWDALQAALDRLRPTVLIHGGARGADRLAGSYADLHGLPCLEVKAPWTFYGNAAGPIRNGWMLKHAGPIDRVLAAPGQTGTANMVGQALRAGIPVEALDGTPLTLGENR